MFKISTTTSKHVVFQQCFDAIALTQDKITIVRITKSIDFRKFNFSKSNKTVGQFDIIKFLI